MYNSPETLSWKEISAHLLRSHWTRRHNGCYVMCVIRVCNTCVCASVGDMCVVCVCYVWCVYVRCGVSEPIRGHVIAKV